LSMNLQLERVLVVLFFGCFDGNGRVAPPTSIKISL
jgi:hypothetical protein